MRTMFPFQQGNELCFQISPNPNNQHQNLPQDLLLNNLHNHRQSRRRRSADNGDTTTTKNDSNKRKLLHRDIERQRRREMTNLHESLRSLLPLEYIKGRRSMSDHMHEATNYIKHLRKKISELNAQKVDLKQQSDLKSTPSQRGRSSSNDSSSSSSSTNSGVLIKPCLDGVEIVFSSGLMDQRSLTLSRVLNILLQNGVSVVNCVSTTVNERIFHTLQAEVKDLACLNLSELKQRLNSLVP